MIEGCFSIFERGMKGAYQHCAKKHLHRYVAEFERWYNNSVANGFHYAARAEGRRRKATYLQKPCRIGIHNAGSDLYREWCGWPGSNRHGRLSCRRLARWLPKPLCLPLPPHPQVGRSFRIALVGAGSRSLRLAVGIVS